ncbi:hypothetical protein ACQKWADRAFT_302113 [Trichoderma austrokoningii]
MLGSIVVESVCLVAQVILSRYLSFARLLNDCIRQHCKAVHNESHKLIYSFGSYCSMYEFAFFRRLMYILVAIMISYVPFKDSNCTTWPYNSR